MQKKISLATLAGSGSDPHSNLITSVAKVATMNVPILRLKIISGKKTRKQRQHFLSCSCSLPQKFRIQFSYHEVLTNYSEYDFTDVFLAHF